MFVSKLIEGLMFLVSRLPRQLSQRLGRLIGLTSIIFKTRAYRVTETNLALCFPEMTRVDRNALLERSLKHTGQTVMETPAAWLATPETLDQWITGTSGEHLLKDAIAVGSGVIILLPHIGNWEMFNAYFAKHGTMTALYQPPRKIYAQQLMKKIRSRFGCELVATNVKGIARLYRVLAEGGIVTILPDQVPSSGVFSPFFGIEALTDQLVSRLIRKTGARVVSACVIRRENGCFDVNFRSVDEAVYSPELEASVRAVNSTVENIVLEFPAQYQWEYKRFRERPTGEEKVYSFNKPNRAH